MPETSNKTTLAAIIVGLVILAGATLLDPFKWDTAEPFDVFAGTATTSVTVLNTPPQWAVDAQEYIESSTSSPTNAGSDAVWVGTAHDDNAENYYLLICKTSSTPTANSSAAPSCNGGVSNRWAVSASTASDVQATSTYTTLVGDVETNEWFAWICDGNSAFPQCNPTYKQGTGTSSSPFYVNHRPSFTAATDSSPADPGQVVTWNTSSSDADVAGGNDTVRLFVCRANDFTGLACGAGGTYCSSTLASANASCSSTLSSVLPDGLYTSYAYVIDNHSFAASGGAQATDTVLTVRNVAPTISTSSVQLLDTSGSTSSLVLANPQAQTTGFKVTFTASDNNSCQNQSAGNEIRVASTLIAVYRSGIGFGNCSSTSNYDPNNCYAPNLPTSTWNVSCTQDGGTCSGQSDPNADFTCTFPFWYIADPTDGTNATDTQFFAQSWLASARVTDDNSSSSAFIETPTGNEMYSYLAYSLNTAAIAFGSLSPGSSTSPLTASTTVTATGNVGLDHTLYGDGMCVTYPSCAVNSVTSTIQIYNQRYATSSVAFSSAFQATSSPGSTLQINIRKTTATSTPASGTTYWGITIPVTLTLAGDYTGQNTIIGIKGEAQSW